MPLDPNLGPNIRPASRSNLRRGAFLFQIDGAGSPPATGIKGDLVIPYAGVITRWTLIADVSGSMVVDLWKDTYANYPPVAGDSITASAKPTISSALKGQSSNLTGWTTAVAVGDVIRVNLDYVSSITRATLVIEITRD